MMAVPSSDARAEAVHYLNTVMGSKWRSRNRRGEPYAVFFTPYPAEVEARLIALGLKPKVLDGEDENYPTSKAFARRTWRELLPGVEDKDFIASPIDSWHQIFPNLSEEEIRAASVVPPPEERHEDIKSTRGDWVEIAVAGKDLKAAEKAGVKIPRHERKTAAGTGARF